ncbi:MAG: hypothetical protein HC768_18660, partial [Acaryochloris sp. CRU_2_0]|nr:hypothetical protein [Acaryochloris sp. CRU_2_0]
KDLMGKAETKTGLKVLTTVLDKVYQTGRKVTQEFKESMEIILMLTSQNGITRLNLRKLDSRSYLSHNP